MPTHSQTASSNTPLAEPSTIKGIGAAFLLGVITPLSGIAEFVLDIKDLVTQNFENNRPPTNKVESYVGDLVLRHSKKESPSDTTVVGSSAQVLAFSTGIITCSGALIALPIAACLLFKQASTNDMTSAPQARTSATSLATTPQIPTLTATPAATPKAP